ncbi:MAG: serine/threonine protein kinase [Deltaproteobacteria bacterium]|nr:serine/threonine protein kinase [Deltaproteobacteria bacterium]
MDLEFEEEALTRPATGALCGYCRAELRNESELEEHEATCEQRRWWFENFELKEQPKVEAAPEAAEMGVCRFCGGRFEVRELRTHWFGCSQRQWQTQNFENARRPKVERPPPLSMPEPVVSGIKGLAKKLITGLRPDTRARRLRAAVERTNLIRDDETFAICRGSLSSVIEVFLGLERSEVSRASESVVPLMLGTAELLVGTAEQMESLRDELFELAPMSIRRELERLALAMERDADVVAKEAELARKLRRCEGLEKQVALLRTKLLEASAKLSSLTSVARPEASPEESQEDLASLESGFEDVTGRLTSHPQGPAGPRHPPPFALPAASLDRLKAKHHAFTSSARIGRYEVLGLLGAGGMGVVYDARSPAGKYVALKTIRFDRSTSEVVESRFRRECLILQKVRHPNCAALLDMGEHGDELYIVLDQVDGAPLSALLSERRLALQEVVGLGLELADALAYLHEVGVVHRDIKPSNILIGGDGHAVITDFGISKLAGATLLTEPSDVLGTPGYVAPELTHGGPATAFADQWSLGRLLLACAVGEAKVPDGTARRMIAAGTRVDWAEFPATREWIPLRGTLEKMLASEPANRFSDLRAVEDALS